MTAIFESDLKKTGLVDSSLGIEKDSKRGPYFLEDEKGLSIESILGKSILFRSDNDVESSLIIDEEKTSEPSELNIMKFSTFKSIWKCIFGSYPMIFKTTYQYFYVPTIKTNKSIFNIILLKHQDALDHKFDRSLTKEQMIQKIIDSLADMLEKHGHQLIKEMGDAIITDTPDVTTSGVTSKKISISSFIEIKYRIDCTIVRDILIDESFLSFTDGKKDMSFDSLESDIELIIMMESL